MNKRRLLKIGTAMLLFRSVESYFFEAWQTKGYRPGLRKEVITFPLRQLNGGTQWIGKPFQNILVNCQ